MRKIFERRCGSLNRHFVPRRNPLRSSAKTSASFAVNDFVLGLLILFVATAFVTQTPTPAAAQTPTPAPSEKRDLGLQSNTASNSQTDQTKSKEAKPELVLQTGYSNFFGATRLVFSSDGRLLATSTFRTNTIKLWDTSSWRETKTLEATSMNASSFTGGDGGMALSPDGNQLARVDADQIKVIDLSGGRELRSISLPGRQLENVELSFTPDGHLLVAGIDE